MDIPTGIIAIWSGTLGSIPAGWTLCDGTSGTPDLTDLFVRGAGDTFNPGDTGGTTTHSHSFTANSHTHTHPGGSQIQAGGGWNNQSSPVSVTGNTNPGTNIPPFHALAYIMKL